MGNGVLFDFWIASFLAIVEVLSFVTYLFNKPLVVYSVFFMHILFFKIFHSFTNFAVLFPILRKYIPFAKCEISMIISRDGADGWDSMSFPTTSKI